MGIISFDRCVLKIIALLAIENVHFQTQLGQVVFKLKKLKIPAEQFSKSKRGLFQKSHFSFVVRESWGGR